ncbi:MAG: antitoxin, partial [Pyrobaculum sp.]
MSDVISVRVRKELKKALEDLGIDYAEEVRRYLEELVARERRRRALERAR